MGVTHLVAVVVSRGWWAGSGCHSCAQSMGRSPTRRPAPGSMLGKGGGVHVRTPSTVRLEFRPQHNGVTGAHNRVRRRKVVGERERSTHGEGMCGNHKQVTAPHKSLRAPRGCGMRGASALVTVTGTAPAARCPRGVPPCRTRWRWRRGLPTPPGHTTARC